MLEWSRYEAALASSEAAAAVDHGRHLSWAASAVMGMDKDGPAPLHKPAKFENASKVSVKQVWSFVIHLLVSSYFQCILCVAK